MAGSQGSLSSVCPTDLDFRSYFSLFLLAPGKTQIGRQGKRKGGYRQVRRPAYLGRALFIFQSLRLAANDPHSGASATEHLSRAGGLRSASEAFVLNPHGNFCTSPFCQLGELGLSDPPTVPLLTVALGAALASWVQGSVWVSPHRHTASPRSGNDSESQVRGVLPVHPVLRAGGRGMSVCRSWLVQRPQRLCSSLPTGPSLQPGRDAR